MYRHGNLTKPGMAYPVVRSLIYAFLSLTVSETFCVGWSWNPLTKKLMFLHRISQWKKREEP